jgi:hypothetical protein
MKSTGFRRKTVLLLFLASLLASLLAFPSAASAGPRLGSAREALAPAASTILEDLLGRAWGFLTGVLSKTGCQIDPDGRCTPVPKPTIQIHEGCYINPEGGCRS